MKPLALSLCLGLALTASAQTKFEYFFDAGWKPCEPPLARFYREAVATDSGWLVSDYYVHEPVSLQMRGLFSDSSAKTHTGRCVWYYPDGKTEIVAGYSDGKYDGFAGSFSPDGQLVDSAWYDHGRLHGTRKAWYRNGMPKDSVVAGADDVTTSVSWFSNGQPSAAGHYRNGKKEGPWTFFDRQGAKTAREMYRADSAIEKTYFKPDGQTMPVSDNPDHGAEFPGGAAKWRKLLGSNLEFPEGYGITNADQVSVVVRFVVDEDGNVTDPEVAVPFAKPFDDAVLKAIRKSPKWKPAIEHNRAAPRLCEQPVNFNAP